MVGWHLAELERARTRPRSAHAAVGWQFVLHALSIYFIRIGTARRIRRTREVLGANLVRCSHFRPDLALVHRNCIFHTRYLPLTVVFPGRQFDVCAPRGICCDLSWCECWCIHMCFSNMFAQHLVVSVHHGCHCRDVQSLWPNGRVVGVCLGNNFCVWARCCGCLWALYPGRWRESRACGARRSMCAVACCSSSSKPSTLVLSLRRR